MTTIKLPSTAIDGLLGMLDDPRDPEFWYRRRQFVVFFGMSQSQDTAAKAAHIAHGAEPDRI